MQSHKNISKIKSQKKQVYTQLTPSPLTIIPHTASKYQSKRVRTGADPTARPVILSLDAGLDLIRESGEPMEFGIFDFYKAFSRAFGEEG